MSRPRTPIAERLWAKVERGTEAECWPWRGWCNTRGYGLLGQPGGTRASQRLVLAHRVAYEQVHGPVPDGLHVMHKCDNPRCCNPAHLRAGTRSDNMRDKEAKGRGNHAVGERHASAKLTEEQAREALAAPRTKNVCMRLAEKFGVSRESIASVRARKTWRYLT